MKSATIAIHDNNTIINRTDNNIYDIDGEVVFDSVLDIMDDRSRRVGCYRDWEMDDLFGYKHTVTQEEFNKLVDIFGENFDSIKITEEISELFTPYGYYVGDVIKISGSVVRSFDTTSFRFGDINFLVESINMHYISHQNKIVFGCKLKRKTIVSSEIKDTLYGDLYHRNPYAIGHFLFSILNAMRVIIKNYRNEKKSIKKSQENMAAILLMSKTTG